MSVSAELWKISSTVQVPDSGQAPAFVSEAGASGDSDDPIGGLVRKVFFPPASTSHPRNVLFLGADQETRVVELCEKAALTLAALSGMKAAVIGGPLLPASMKRPAQSITESGLWRAHSLALSDRVWRLPVWLFRDRFAQETHEPRGPLAEFRTLFKYFLFAANAGNSDLAGFAGICDAAVLVVTANRSRKEAALHAQHQLGQCKLPLLGTVLTERVLEVPEAIYRRL